MWEGTHCLTFPVEFEFPGGDIIINKQLPHINLFFQIPMGPQLLMWFLKGHLCGLLYSWGVSLKTHPVQTSKL